LNAPHDWSKFLLFLLRCMSLFMMLWKAPPRERV
jgi:hypothetical protein